MTVLVTGATSLIGSVVVDRLVARGDQVRCFQRRPRTAGHPPGAIDVLGDLTDPSAVSRAVEGVRAVIHLGAKVGVVGDRRDYEATNVGGTELLLDAARTIGVERFVHVSSPSVAHRGEPLVGASAAPADPTSTRGHYATTKAVAEQRALAASSEDFPVVAVRPHLVWGPGDTQLVGRIVQRAEQGRLALVGSGSALIDTTYVDNAADALIAALDRCHSLGGQAFVVSNGQPRTVAELVARICAAAGVPGPRIEVPPRVAFLGGLVAETIWSRTARVDDPPMTSFLAEQLSTAHWFDQRPTQAALGWKPEVDLDEGFARLARSFATGAYAAPRCEDFTGQIAYDASDGSS